MNNYPNVTAAQISGGGEVQIQDGNNLTLTPVNSDRSDNFGAGNADTHFLSNQDLVSVGSKFAAQDTLTVEGKNSQSFYAAQDTVQSGEQLQHVRRRHQHRQ